MNIVVSSFIALNLGDALLAIVPADAFWRLQCEDSRAIARLEL